MPNARAPAPSTTAERPVKSSSSWPMASGTEEGGGASGSPSRIVCCARAETASNNETASPRPSLERPNAAPARGAAGGAAAPGKAEGLAILGARAYHGAPRGPGALLAYDGRVPLLKRRGEIALALASLVMGLGLAEAGARLLGAGSPHASGYAPVNTRRRGMSPTNARGYRDNEHPTAKPPGVRRLLSLGDSFAWGAGVEFEDAYPQRLERGMRRRRREPWRVVNLALPGMNTVDEASQLTEEGFAYQPDIVLVGYVLNDSEDAEAAEARRARDWAEEREQKRDPRFLDRSA